MKKLLFLLSFVSANCFAQSYDFTGYDIVDSQNNILDSKVDKTTVVETDSTISITTSAGTNVYVRTNYYFVKDEKAEVKDVLRNGGVNNIINFAPGFYGYEHTFVALLPQQKFDIYQAQMNNLRSQSMSGTDVKEEAQRAFSRFQTELCSITVRTLVEQSSHKYKDRYCWLTFPDGQRIIYSNENQ